MLKIIKKFFNPTNTNKNFKCSGCISFESPDGYFETLGYCLLSKKEIYRFSYTPTWCKLKIRKEA